MTTRHTLFLAYLHTLAFALVTIAVVLFVGRPDHLTQANGAITLVRIGAALGALTGGMLLAATYHRRRLALFFSLLLAVAAISSQAGPIAGVPFLTEVVHTVGLGDIPFPLALALLLIAIAIPCYGWGRPGRIAGQVLALLILAVGALSLLAILPQSPLPSGWNDLLPELQSGITSDFILTANILVVMTGVGILALNSLSDASPPQLNRATVLAGILCTILTCLGWQLMNIHNLETDQFRREQLLDSAKHMIQNQRLAQINLIRRVAERWTTLDQFPAGQAWRQESKSYLRDHPNLKLIGILDDTLIPMGLTARDLEHRTWLHRFLQMPDRRDWLSHILISGEPHMSPSSGPEAMTALIAAPLRVSNRNWLIIASVDVEAMIARHVNAEHSGYIVRVIEEGQVIFDSKGRPQRSLTLVEQTVSDYHHDSSWHIGIYLDPQGMMQRSSLLPPAILLFGLGLTVLLMVSQRLAWQAKVRSRRLDEANLELSESLAQQYLLQAANERMMQYSKDILCSFDRHGHITQVSPACRTVLGYEPWEMIGEPYTKFLLPEDYAGTREVSIEAMRSGGGTNHRNRYRRKDGSIAHMLWSAGWSSEAQELFCVGRDITKLAAAERLESDRQRILSMISTDQSLSQTLEAVCLMVEAQLPGLMCAVMLTDSTQKRLTIGAAPNLPEDWCRAIDGNAYGVPVESCTMAALRGETVVAEDIASDPLWASHVGTEQVPGSYRDLAISHGLRACWCEPILSPEGAVLGTLALYSGQPPVPNNEHMELISASCRITAIAIERDQDRKQLIESEQHYRSLFTFNPELVFSIDLEGQFESINRAGVALLGYPESELLGKGFSFLICEEELPKVDAHFAAAVAGQPQHYEAQVQSQDRRIFDLEITNLPIMVDGKVAGVFGVAKDVTAHNRMLQALRERDQFYRLSLDMFCTLDFRGHFIQVNPAFSKALGYSAEQLIGRTYSELISANDTANVEKAIGQLKEGQKVQNLEIQVVDSDKGIRWLELNAAPGDDNTIHCAARDITQRKLTEEQLQSTLSELASSNQELENFAFVASHDLQEPLRKIQAFSERLQTRTASLDEQSQDYLQRMSNAARRMQTLIQDLLSYSRVSTRKQPFVALELDRVLDEVLSDLETTVKDSQAIVTRESLPSIQGDLTQIRQVFQNLISNAVKFAQKGVPPHIRVYAENSTPESWTLCISDNGIGFDEKYLDRIFDPFQRLHSRQAYPGTGIGLAIVAKILERHDAAITATSTSGVGTIFRITFNRAIAQRDTA